MLLVALLVAKMRIIKTLMLPDICYFLVAF